MAYYHETLGEVVDVGILNSETDRLRKKISDLKAENQQLRESIQSLTYEQDGRYYSAIHGDTDVTGLAKIAYR